jgi:hypothetical protein
MGDWGGGRALSKRETGKPEREKEENVRKKE